MATISSIMRLIVSPLESNHAEAVEALQDDPVLFSRCQLFVLINEGFGGFGPDEIRQKWETRAARRYFAERRALARKRVHVSGRWGDGFCVRYDESIVSPRYETRSEALAACRRLIVGVVAGLNPQTALFEMGES